MADFRGYLCWDTATAGTTINTEAISPSRAVFLATHAPLRIRRARLDGRTLALEGQPVDENAVLHDFLNRKADSGALLMPIVGDSGSGKSHLVRWVKERTASTDSRQVIYLEKAKTSLKAVIQALLAGVDNDELAQLKSDIGKFTVDIDETALAWRLINALNETLAASTSNASGLARRLPGPKGLAVVLLDPHVREFMLTPGQFIPRLASQLLHDRKDGEAERPEGFSVDDLPLEIVDMGQASQVAKTWLNALSTNTDLQSAAVDLLNEHLEAAVKSAANLGMGRLLDAMTAVRREYARQGKEIVLLIEDFALIQGVQRELLDAVIEAANREGKTALAPIRTLMAVTTGYFRDLPETALTRVRAATGYVYDLDVPFSEDDRGTSQITSFVGRYLNAARLGREELELIDDPTNPPNQCTSCPMQQRCHDAFGVSAEGFGLYPFNESTLIRTVHSTAPKDTPWAFVPRTVLGSVVRSVLVEDAASLKQGTFPDARFRERFPLSPIDAALSTAVRGVIDTSDASDPDRRKLVLEFWGDAPNRATTLSAALLDAFALEPLRGDEVDVPASPHQEQIPERGGATTLTPPASQIHSLPASLTKKLQIVEDWVSREKVLPQATAREIRGIVIAAVVQRYRWHTPLMQEQLKPVLDKAWPNNSTVMSIDGADERLPGTANAPIRFTRRALDSQFFQSLLCAQQGYGQVRAEDVRRLCSVAEQYSGALGTAIQRNMEISDTDLVLGLRASLLGAALAGRAWPGMDTAEMLSAALDGGQGWARSDANTRTGQWNGLLASHLRERPGLVERIKSSVGIAQGQGAVTMIDAARVMPLLDEAASEWNWLPSGSDIPTWVKSAVTGFASWLVLIDDQTALLEANLRDVRVRQPRGTTSVQALAAIREALRAAREDGGGGLQPGREQGRELDTLLERCQNADWKPVSELEDDLLKAAEPTRSGEALRKARIVAAVRDRGEAFDSIRQLMLCTDHWLDAALKNAASRSSAASDGVALGVQELLDEWRALAAREATSGD